MDASPQVLVTLSKELLAHLRKLAQAKHVPLQWLVAGLVCDTMESGLECKKELTAALAGR